MVFSFAEKLQEKLGGRGFIPCIKFWHLIVIIVLIVAIILILALVLPGGVDPLEASKWGAAAGLVAVIWWGLGILIFRGACFKIDEGFRNLAKEE